MSKPEVAVIVLNYNGMRFLETCFRSLHAATYPKVQFILFDNNSTDESVEFVRQNFPKVKIVNSFINGGYSRAYNEAIKHSNAPYAVFLNNDVEVDPGWLEPLVEAAESDEKIAALQPKLIWLLDRTKFEYAGSSGGEMDKYGYPFLRGRIFYTIESDTGQYNDEKEIFWASGAAMFVRSRVFTECIGLDETFVHHMEEIDLCWRIHLLGYKIKVIPRSVVAHWGGATITPDSFKKMYWNHRNSMFMLFKNLGSQNFWGILIIHFLFDIVAIIDSVIKLSFKRGVAIIYAYSWLLVNIPLLIRERGEVQRMRKVDDKVIFKLLYPRSIVLQYFVLKRKTYSTIKK
ncbi:MAG: glycosyltransferase family 2 protein [Bacteroidia bacterium]